MRKYKSKGDTKKDFAACIASHSSIEEHDPVFSTTRTEVAAALKLNLITADAYNKLSLSSGYTVPVEEERVIKQAALNSYCAEKYFDDEEKQGLPIYSLPRWLSLA